MRTDNFTFCNYQHNEFRVRLVCYVPRHKRTQPFGLHLFKIMSPLEIKFIDYRS